MLHALAQGGMGTGTGTGTGSKGGGGWSEGGGDSSHPTSLPNVAPAWPTSSLRSCIMYIFDIGS